MIAWRRFMARSKEERVLLIEAASTLALVQAALLLLPFRRLAPMLSRGGLVPSVGDEAGQIGRIGWAVAAAGRRLPWRSRCLAQAMAAKLMLRRRGIANALCLGVASGERREIRAHAWLLSGARCVTGGSEGGQGYAMITRFVDGGE